MKPGDSNGNISVSQVVKTISSAIADKSRDAFVQYAVFSNIS